MRINIKYYGLLTLLVASLVLISCSSIAEPDPLAIQDEGDVGPICAGTVWGYDPLAGTYYPLVNAIVVVRTWPVGCESYGWDYTNEDGHYEVYNMPGCPRFNYEGTYCLVDCAKIGYYNQTIGPIMLPQEGPLNWTLEKQ